MTHHM